MRGPGPGRARRSVSSPCAISAICSTDPPRGLLMSSELASLAALAHTAGWGAAMYQHACRTTETGMVLGEDDRAADLRYLLPRACRGGGGLVLGAGLGAVPIALRG